MSEIIHFKLKKQLNRRRSPIEFKLVPTRKLAPESMAFVRSPAEAADYWRKHIENHPFVSLETECLVALLLNTHLRVLGHSIISIGSVSANIVHPREVFRAAVIAGASAVLLLHNHPSGESSPSQSDIEVTRILSEGSAILGIELVDHVVIGHRRHSSIADLGHMPVIDGYGRRLKVDA